MLKSKFGGICAIIVTLLVLEIKVPHLHEANSVDELIHALQETVPKFIAWVISFFTVMVIWVNHHRHRPLQPGF